MLLPVLSSCLGWTQAQGKHFHCTNKTFIKYDCPARQLRPCSANRSEQDILELTAEQQNQNTRNVRVQGQTPGD